MFDITHHQGIANQNHKEITPHTCQDGYPPTGQAITNAGCGEQTTLPGENVISTSTMENGMKVSHNIKNRTTI